MIIDPSWIKGTLPAEIPDNILQKALSYSSDIVGLDIYESDMRGPPKLSYQAKNLDDLHLWFVVQALNWIAQHMELLHREKQEKYWRYVRDHVEENHWIYRENREYTYNAICDSRKFWMEYHLRLLKPELSEKDWQKKIVDYEQYMNLWFHVPHWKFDETALEFIEISDSRSHDSQNIDEPREGSVMTDGTIGKSTSSQNAKPSGFIQEVDD